MNTYHVTYFYSATGMDEPDTRDFGTFRAESEQEVKDIVMSVYFPESEGAAAEFIKGCLTISSVNA